METVGGRAVHPVNVRVGGFYRAPDPGRWRRWPSPSPGPRRRAGHRRVGGGLRLPRRRPATTASWRCATPDRYAIERGRPCVVRRPRREPGRVRRPRRRGARGPLHRPARPARRSRPVPHRAPGPLRAQRGPRSRRSPPRRPRRPGSGRCAPTRSAASWCGPSSWCSPATRRSRLVESYDAARPARRRRDARGQASGTGATEAPRGLLFHQYEIDARGHDPAGPHRAADLPEPAHHRGGPAPRGPGRPRPERRRPAVALRAGGAQPRPLHLVRRPLPRRHGGAGDDRGRRLAAPGSRAGPGHPRASWWPAWGTSTGATTAPVRRCAARRRRALRRRATSARRSIPSTCSGGGTTPTWPSSIDAIRSGAPPGTVRVVELTRRSGAGGSTDATSTHGIGLAGVLRLAQAVGQAPRAGRRGRHRGGRLRAGAGAQPRRRGRRPRRRSRRSST